MESLGKNTTVIERRVERHPLVAGDGIAIEDLDKGHRISCTIVPTPAEHVDLEPIKENLVGIQSVVEAQVAQLSGLSESIKHIGKGHTQLRADFDKVVSELQASIAELAARPAQQILTRTVEKPGITVHEVRSEFKAPLLVWFALAALALSNLFLWSL